MQKVKFVLEPRLAHKAPFMQTIVLHQRYAEDTSKTRTTDSFSCPWFSQEIVCFDEICFNAESKKSASDLLLGKPHLIALDKSKAL